MGAAAMMGSYLDLILSPWWVVCAVATFGATLLFNRWANKGLDSAEATAEQALNIATIHDASPLLARLAYSIFIDPIGEHVAVFVVFIGCVFAWPIVAFMYLALFPRSRRLRTERLKEPEAP